MENPVQGIIIPVSHRNNKRWDGKIGGNSGGGVYIANLYTNEEGEIGVVKIEENTPILQGSLQQR